MNAKTHSELGYSNIEYGNKIDLRKINLALHLEKLDDNALAKQVFEEQKRNKWPGLYKEVKEICRLWGLENVCHEKEKKMTKYKWKKLLKNVVNEKNKKDILEASERYTKLEDMKNESYGTKSYLREMSMQNARMMLRIRSKMV